MSTRLPHVKERKQESRRRSSVPSLIEFLFLLGWLPSWPKNCAVGFLGSGNCIRWMVVPTLWRPNIRATGSGCLAADHSCAISSPDLSGAASALAYKQRDFPRILEAVQHVARINREPIDTFRIDAAGSSSAGFRQLADQIEDSTGLAEVAEGGDVLLRFRRSARLDGWGCPSATLSAAAIKPRLESAESSGRGQRDHRCRDEPNDIAEARRSVLNLMCGSGTLLIERLLMAPARLAVGVDIDQESLSYCAENLDAAGLRGRANLLNWISPTMNGLSWTVRCHHGRPTVGDANGRSRFQRSAAHAAS